MGKYSFVDPTLDSYKKETLNNVDLSNVVREMILNDCVSATGYYNVKDAIRMVGCLDEYLKHNIANLDSYEFGNHIFLGTNLGENSFFYDGHRRMTKLSIFNSLDSNNPFNLYTDGYPGAIHYKLKKPATYKELAESNLGVVSLDIIPYNILQGYFSANKCYMKNGLYCEETYVNGKFSTYKSDREICAYVYDLNAAINRNACNSRLECPVYPYSNETQNDLDPWLIRYENPIFSVNVLVKPKAKVRFIAHYKDETGRHIEEITGETIYSAYYDFMMKKGFFDDKSFVKVKK